MAILKCKMCGGDIVVNEEKAFGTCEYFGSVMTLPKGTITGKRRKEIEARLAQIDNELKHL